MIRTLQNIFFRDFWLKLFSLVLATLIWLIVYLFAIKKDVSPSAGLRGNNSVERDFTDVPVLAVSTNDARTLKMNPPRVTVILRGDRHLIENVRAAEIRAIADLTGVALTHDLTNRIAVTVPPNVTLVSTDPESVQVIVPPKR